MPRALLVLVLATTASGCFRYVRYDLEKRRMLEDALDSTTFPLTQPQLEEKLKALPVNGVDWYGAGRYGFCVKKGCFLAWEDPPGTLHIEVRDAGDEDIGTLWSALDPAGYQAARERADAFSEADVAHEEDSFVPRWTFTAGASGGMAFDTGRVSLGGRVGARRWVNSYLLGDLVLDYAYVFGPPNTSEVALDARAAFSLWSHWSERHLALPELSAYLLAGPAFSISAAEGAGGFRAGAGFQATNVSGGCAAPFFVELYFQRLYLRASDAGAFHFVVGFGI